MKPQRSFVAQRPLAQHCAELIPARAAAADPFAAAQGIGARLARELATNLAPHYGGGAPEVLLQGVTSETGTEVLAAPAGLAAHSVHALGTATGTALVTVDAVAVFELLDRAFGGRGEAPVPLPPQFPPSAHLLLEALQAGIGQALGKVVHEAGPVTLLRHGSDLAELEPFALDAALIVFRLEVTPSVQRPWPLRIAFPVDAVTSAPSARAPTLRPRAAGDPAAAPFAAIAVPLRAVLVDMAVPVGRLAALQPGQVLPVAVARAVPLRAGSRTIAHGTVGSQDDRVALQLTHLA